MENANITIVVNVREGNESNFDVEAFSKESASVFITASSMADATKLMEKAESIAKDKMQSFTEQPKEGLKEAQHKEEKHYLVAPVTKEDADKQIKEYKQTASGKRFYTEIENGMLFARKRDHGLNAVSGKYLALESYVDSPYISIMYAYDLAYKRGYAAGKREEKAKHNKAI